MKGYLAVLFGTTLSVLSSLAQAQQTVILVRHAELMGGQAMAEPKHVPLSEAGEARAQRLASFLKDSGISAIYVTDFVRTNKTAEPLSRELKMAPTVLPKGDPAALVERRSEEHTSELQSLAYLVCRLLLEKKKKRQNTDHSLQIYNQLEH